MALALKIGSTNMPQINDRDIETVEKVGKIIIGTGVAGMTTRLLWKIINKFAASADAGSKKNEAEETLWQRLQDQIQELQQSKLQMQVRIDSLSVEMLELRKDNLRLQLENEYFKRKVDEQVDIIANFEKIMSNVKITDKGKHE